MQKDMDRLLFAARKNKDIKTWAQLARLLNETDQTMTNWKARGIPGDKLMGVAERVGANPYWIRDGGDLPMAIEYMTTRPDVLEIMKVAEKLPPEYIKAEIAQMDAAVHMMEQHYSKTKQ